jgi:WD40 repeat protein
VRAARLLLTLTHGEGSGGITAKFMPDGRHVVSATAQGAVEMWDMLTPTKPRVVGRYPAFINAVAVSRDGLEAATAARDGTVCLWSLQGHQPLRAPGRIERFLDVRGKTIEVHGLEFSPDRRRLLCSLASGQVAVVDLTKTAPPAFYPTSGVARSAFNATMEVSHGLFYGDGKSVLSTRSDDDQTVSLWEPGSGRPPVVQEGVRGITRSADNALSLSIETGAFMIWDVARRRLMRTCSGDVPNTIACRFGADWRLFFGRRDGRLDIWDLRSASIRLREQTQVLNARERLQDDPNNAEALAVLGHWYAGANADYWAVECFERARTGGVAVAPEELGRGYWRLGRKADAHAEFLKARATSAPDDVYLRLLSVATDDPIDAPSGHRRAGP